MSTFRIDQRVRFKYRGPNDARKRWYTGRVRELGSSIRVEWEMEGVLNVCSFAASELEPVKLRAGECVGREATMRCDVANNGGAHIKAGERVRIVGLWRGTFEIEADKPPRYIRRVPRAKLDVGDGQ